MHHKQLLVFKWTGWMENNWVTGMAFPWPWGQHFLSCGSATLLVNFRGWYYLSSPWPKWVLDSETDFVRFCPNSRMCPHPWSMEPVACNHLLWPGPYQAPGCAKGKKVTVYMGHATVHSHGKPVRYVQSLIQSSERQRVPNKRWLIHLSNSGLGSPPTGLERIRTLMCMNTPCSKVHFSKVHSVNTNVLSTCYAPGLVLGAGPAEMNPFVP